MVEADKQRWTATETGGYFEREAKRILASLGFTEITDGPTLAPYDLTASRRAKRYYVEVRGSLSQKLGVTYSVQAGKLAALSRLENVLFLFIAGKAAERWKLVEFENLKDLRALVRLYSGDFRVGTGTTRRTLTVPSGNPLGRPRTLLGTRPVLLRIDRRLVELLDEQADEEGLSRQVLVTRLLAEAVRNRSPPLKNKL